MGDLSDPRAIVLKGLLFLVAGVLAATLLILDHPTLLTAGLLVTAVFCFARFYYFAFYVLSRYVDEGYRFAGLISLAAHVIRTLRRRR